MKKLQKKHIILTCIILCCSAFAIGQTTLTGKVTDKENLPVYGALVMILDENEKVFISVTTDTTGVYNITLPQNKNNHLLYVSSFGYHEQKLTLNEALKKPTFVLETKLHNLDEVTVTANRPHIIRNMDKFVVPQIYQSPLAQGKNIVDFLKFAPLITVSSNDVLSILNKGPAVIYVNGRRSNIDIKSLPAENIEKVEIIPFPGSEYPASITTGIINIVLRKRPNDGINTNVSLSDSQSRRNSQSVNVFLDVQKGKTAVTIGISGNSSNSIDDVESKYTYFTENLTTFTNMNTKYRGNYVGGFLNFDYEISKKQTFGFQVSGGLNESNSKSTSITDFYTVNSLIVDSSEISKSKNLTPKPGYGISSNANYNLKINDEQRISVDFDYRKSYSQKQSLFDCMPNEIMTKQPYKFITDAIFASYGYSLKTDYTFKPDDGNTFKAGVNFNRISTDNDFFHGNSNGIEYISDTLRTNRFLYKDLLAAAYFRYEWSINDNLGVIAGARAEYYDYDGIQKTTNEVIKNDYLNFFPSFSINYAFNENNQEIGFNFTRNIHRPTHYMLNPFRTYYSPTFYIENNPNLKPGMFNRFGFNYNYKTFIMFFADYNYMEKGWTEFTIPVGNGITKRITDNYGKYHNFSLSASFSFYFFNNRLNLQLIPYFNYGKVMDMPDHIVTYNTKSFMSVGDIKLNLLLNKKGDFYLQSRFQYTPEYKAISINSKASNYSEISLYKSFKNSTLSIGVNDILYRPVEDFLNGETYSFSTIDKYYGRTVWVSYYMRFGNDRVKNVQQRDNSGLNRIK